MNTAKQIVVVALTAVLGACSEELPDRLDGCHVTFSVESQADGTATRGQTAVAVLQKETLLESDIKTAGPLYLTATAEEGINGNETTRAAQVGNADVGTQAFTLGVSEFAADDAVATVSGFSNLMLGYANYDGTGLYDSGEQWQDDAYTGTAYKFFAYSPYVSGTENGITPNWADKTITYDASVVTDATDMPDLMTAYASSEYIGAVPLTFHHRLCAIRILLGAEWVADYQVSSIQFKNVVTSGTLTINADKDAAWTGTSTGNCSITSGFEYTATESGVYVAGRAGSSTYLMMIPQTLSSSRLVVTLTDNSSTTHTLTADITGTWQAGKTVTYTINPQSIGTLTASYPSGWTLTESDETTIPGPVTSYCSGEAFGLFAINKDGTLAINNLRMTANVDGGLATLVSTSPGTFLSRQYKYFLYYPYREGMSAATVTASATTANGFFSSVITGWTVTDDQHLIADLKANDLQVGMLDNGNFDMSHQMGLARLQLMTEDIPGDHYHVYKNNVEQTAVSKPTLTVTASNEFNTYIPYLSDGIYYFVQKAGAVVSFESVQNIPDHWSDRFSISAGYTSTVREIHSQRVSRYTHYYEYTGGASYTFSIPHDGNYFFQCWGAAGGTGTLTGYDQANIDEGQYYGHGAYTEGWLSLTTASNSGSLYVYVGGRGANGVIGSQAAGGYNGGGKGGWDTNDGAGGGGGATDIRLTNDATAWTSRIMVAAGGGGGATTYITNTNKSYSEGMDGGAPNVTGMLSTWSDSWTPHVGQSQTVAGTSPADTNESSNELGVGVEKDGTGQSGHGSGGGGGGYYGGTRNTLSLSGRAAGGSSYISGHADCTASNGMTFTDAAFKKGTATDVPSMTLGASPAALGQTDGHARITIITDTDF